MFGLSICLLCHLLTHLGQNALGSEIINGKNAPENSMQFMVSLQANGKHVCGGFLIRDDYVLTAAHCNNSMRVVLGSHNLKIVKNDAVREIKLMCQHPSYKNIKLGHDIMLLKLDKKVRLDNRVKVIKLTKPGNKIKDMQKCNVSGWGYTKSKRQTVDVLQVVDVPIINLKECKNKWAPNVTLPDNIICAGGYGTNKGFCQGDSGGPLVCNGVAVGVVSFNFRKICEYPTVPNVYTDISKYLPWINKILKTNKCK